MQQRVEYVLKRGTQDGAMLNADNPGNGGADPRGIGPGADGEMRITRVFSSALAYESARISARGFASVTTP